MHKDVSKELEYLYSPREIFIHHDELNPTELSNKEANLIKNL